MNESEKSNYLELANELNMAVPVSDRESLIAVMATAYALGSSFKVAGTVATRTFKLHKQVSYITGEAYAVALSCSCHTSPNGNDSGWYNIMVFKPEKFPLLNHRDLSAFADALYNEVKHLENLPEDQDEEISYGTAIKLIEKKLGEIRTLIERIK